MAERRGVKRDCSFLSAESPLGSGTYHVLTRDCGDDQPFEIMHYLKGVIINQPGLVAAVGGIPDELKIKDGISFSYPCPTFKVPKNLPQDPTQCYTALAKAFEENMAENDHTNTLYQAYAAAALRMSKKSEEDEAHNMINDQQPPTPSLLQVISKELMEEGGLHNLSNQQLPPSMVEVNVAVPPVHPIPTNKQQAAKCGDYSLCRVKTRDSYTIQFLRRDCGDGTVEIVHLKALLVNKPGVVLAVGGIPDELKIKGGISFSFPFPVFKLPKKLPQDPTQQKKAVYEIYKEAVLKYGCKKAFIQAYNKALGIGSLGSISEQQSEEKEKEKAHNIDHEPPTMVEVNLAEPLRSKDQIKSADMAWIFLK